MGRYRGGGKGNKRLLRRDFKESRSDEWQDKRPRTDGWEEAITNNENFNEYYQGQNICPPEEWDALLEALRRPLPTTFRINGTGKFATELRDRLQTDFLSRFSNAPLEIDGEVVAPPAALPWYPDDLGWSFSFSKAQLRKLPALEALHGFMKRETAVGGISRQEAVSMVPPLFLDVRPGHRVLDMCAAPGSKTAQILEALHSAGGGPDVGCVVANDADAKRCNLLTHQTLRLCSPALVVTNHEAQFFPMLRDLTAEAGAAAEPGFADQVPASTEGAETRRAKSTHRHILFDRVLADVPCSGDGTIRKAPDIWRRWTAGNGNGLHTLQLRVALRGAELLAVGGRMVYSTCAFNPVEDEAVVAELLRRTGGALELVDVSSELPALRRVPGLASWRVRDRAGWHDAWQGDGEHGYKLAPSMFPGDDTAGMHLERCMRFLPHHQDTGGFFVAVLQKVRPLEGKLEYPLAPGQLQRQQPKPQSDVEGPAAPESADPEQAAPVEQETAAEPADAQEEADMKEAEPAEEVAAAVQLEAEEVAGVPPNADQTPAAGADAGEVAAPASKREPQRVEAPVWGATRGGGGRGREGGGRWGGIDPIVPFTSDEHLSSMRSFFGMPDDCPVLGALISRSTDPKPKRLNYVSAAAKHLLLNDVRESLKVTSAGVKVFERQESKDGLVGCIYRLAQEGLPTLLPYLRKQVLLLAREELTALLTLRLLQLPEQAQVHITRGPAAAAAATTPAAAVVAKTDGAESVAAETGAAAAGTAETDATGGEAGEPAKEEAGEPAKEEAGEPAKEAEIKALNAEQSGDEQTKQPAGNKSRKMADPESLAQMTEISYGGCIAMLRGAGGTRGGDGEEGSVLAAATPIALSCWRGRAALTVLASTHECSTIHDLLAEKAAAAASGAPDS